MALALFAGNGTVGNMNDPILTQELEWHRDLRIGDTGPDVRRLQEWLILNGITDNDEHKVVVDGTYGARSAAAALKARAFRGLPAKSDPADADLFRALSMPLRTAGQDLHLEPGSSFRDYVVGYARQHLSARPHELAEQNSGPWVRYYMGGHQGPVWPWCAGFISKILRQASSSTGVPIPFSLSYGCTELARAADKVRRHVVGHAMPDETLRRLPGSVFVVPGHTQGLFSHTGIVLSVDGGIVVTAEGNTNEEGGRDGKVARSHRRAITALDFLLTD